MSETSIRENVTTIARPVRRAVMARQAPGTSARGLSLRANFSWTFASNIIYAGCQWGSLVVLAKLGSPVMVGQFTLGLAVTAPIMLFTNLQLRGVQVTDTKGDYRFGDYLALRLVMTTIALAGIAWVVLAGYRGELAAIILIIGLAKALESIGDVIYGLQQQHERMDQTAISTILKGLSLLAALTLGVYLTGGVLWGVIGLAASWALILCGYDMRRGAGLLAAADKNDAGLRRSLPASARPRWRPGTLLRLAWLALPMGIVMSLISLNANIPRYFIERQFGTHELGIFAALAYLMVAGGTLVQALGQATVPRMAHYYSAGDYAAYRALLLKLLAIGTALGAAGIGVAMLAGRPILLLLYRPEYAERADLFAWVMVAAGISYLASALGYGMTAARYFRSQVPLFFAVSAVTVGACFFLLPAFHLLGAVLALVIAKLVELLGSAAIVAHALRREISAVQGAGSADSGSLPGRGGRGVPGPAALPTQED